MIFTKTYPTCRVTIKQNSYYAVQHHIIFSKSKLEGPETKKKRGIRAIKKIFYALKGEKLLNAPTSKKNSRRARFGYQETEI